MAPGAVRCGYSMGTAFHTASRAVGRIILWKTMRHVVLDADRAACPGGFILAATHIGNIEAVTLSALLHRQIRWMVRVEYFKPGWPAALLYRYGAFPVARHGNALPAVRAAVQIAGAGGCVGIFPEGRVAHGDQSLLRGGPIKGGVCTIAIATGLPVVPVIVIGTDRLNRVAPWLPFRRGRLWTAFGNRVLPPERSKSRRACRAEMLGRLHAEFLRTYQDMLGRCGLTDAAVP